MKLILITLLIFSQILAEDLKVKAADSKIPVITNPPPTDA
jgi:hypothetical protein